MSHAASSNGGLRQSRPSPFPTVAATRSCLTQAMAARPPHLRPVYQAVRDHRVPFLLVGQHIRRFVVPKPGPFIALLADDPGLALGPASFHARSVKKVIRSVRAVTIITGAAYLALYEAAAALTVTGQSVLIIETRLEQEIPWAELVRRIAPSLPILISTVPGGTA